MSEHQPDSLASQDQEQVLMLVLTLQIGGLERMVSNLAQELQDQGHRVQICCIRSEIGALANDLTAKGIPVKSLNSDGGLSFATTRKLRNLLVDERITALHSHNASALTYGAAACVGLPAISHVNTKHGSEQKNWRSAIRNGLSHLGTNAIVAVSAELQEQIAAEPFSRGKLHMIDNGVPDPRSKNPANASSPRNLDPQAPHLGHIARLHPYKNQELLLQSFGKFVATIPGARLSIVGDGEERKRLENLSRELDIVENVDFLGVRSDIEELIETFDWIVFTSKSEGTPMVAIEAYAGAKPITSTPVGGMVDMVKNGKTGYLSENNTPEAVVATWMQMLDNTDNYAAMCQAARLCYENAYSVKQMANTYLSLYRGGH